MFHFTVYLVHDETDIFFLNPRHLEKIDKPGCWCHLNITTCLRISWRKKIQRNLCDRTEDNSMNHIPNILVANLVKSILIFPEKIIFTFPNFGLLYFFWYPDYGSSLLITQQFLEINLPTNIWYNMASILKIRFHHFVKWSCELIFTLFTCKFCDICSQSVSFPLLFKRELSDFSVIDRGCHTRVLRI